MLSSKDLKFFTSLKLKKNRIKFGKFLIEGNHLIQECLRSEYKMECAIVCTGFGNEESAVLIESISSAKIPVHFVKKHQFSKISETESSQGIIGVVQKKEGREIDYDSGELIVVLDHINDPGNLGTIIRTCSWFNVDYMIMSKDSVDLYNSKVIRSTQGAIFHLKIVEEIEIRDELLLLDKKGFDIFLFDPRSNMELEKVNVSKRNVLVFGNEAGGISEDILQKSYRKLKVRNFSNSESLNVSVCCGIALNFFRTNPAEP